ncbi:MAG TPA: HdeD family acid-resistance protein [Xanthobacteraceae bacterium]|nr:HdeD family acid-resistance protein [Xanthobacteraceae bacterium]
MTSTSPHVTSMPSAVRDVLRAHWKLFLFQGVVMIILGIIAVAMPAAATVAIDIYVGWLFLLSGIVGLVAMFSAGNLSTLLWTLVTALLSVVVGVMLIWQPVAGAFSLTLVLTAFFIAEGIFQTVSSFSYRDVIPGSWGWLLASGISDLLLAGIIIWAWPTSAQWVLGLVVGVNLATSGAAVVMMAIAGRDGG